MTSRISRAAAFAAPLPAIALVTTALAAAQEGYRQLPPPQTVVVQTESAPPAIVGRDIPPPPAAAYQGPPKVAQLVPVGTSPVLPEPSSPPTAPGGAPQGGLDGPGDFKFFYNVDPRPTGGSVSQSLIEPTATINRDVAIYTGNSFAALSHDSGQTWSHLNPYTRFGALDSGFCCDQRVLQVGSPNMTLWLLEYRYSSSTQNGSLRIAYANGRDDLKNDNWGSFVVNPQTFGFGTGFFLDFSDLAAGSTHLYGSAIVARGSNNSAAGLVLWRASLADVANGGSVSLSYYTTTQLGGYGNYRFAHGSTSKMYWAAHHNTTNLRVYEWDEAGCCAAIYTRAVPQWSGTPTPAPGPDARDWTGFGYTVNTVLAGFRRSASHIGFMWTSGAIGSRPMQFVRVARFDPTNGMSLLGTDDIWHGTIAWHFPSAAVNSRGDVGGTLAYGGGGFYPSVTAFIVDQYAPNWAPLPNYGVRTGQKGPSGNRWGDYFHAERNSNLPLTFLGTGFIRRTDSAGEPRYAWFGREETAPTWVALAVQSAPSGASITVEEADRLGRTSGTAAFTREYPPNQGYTLTAPATRSVGGVPYLFYRWRYQTVPGGTIFNRPIGETTFVNGSIGGLDDTAVADYLLSRRLSVTSVNPSSGVPITVSPPDFNQAGNGTTPFTRNYYDLIVVTMTAPASMGFNAFRHWTVNGVVATTKPTLVLPMDGTKNCQAVYWNNVAGKVARIGAGCRGTNGLIPRQTIKWPGGQQGPQQGTVTDYILSDARANTATVLFVGIDTKRWGAFPLPLALDFLGMKSCVLYHDIVVSSNGTTNGAGQQVKSIVWPVDPSAIGGSIFTTFAIVDFGANPVHVVLSDAWETVQGGNR